MMYDNVSSEYPVFIRNAVTNSVPDSEPWVCIAVIVTAEENATCIQGVGSLLPWLQYLLALFNRAFQGSNLGSEW